MSEMLLSTWLAEHARGDVDREAGDAIMEVAEAVTMLEKKSGTVTLKITFEKSGRMVLTTCDVAKKVPKPEPEASTWFAAGTALSRQDPMALVLPFEEQALRVDPATGEIASDLDE